MQSTLFFGVGRAVITPPVGGQLYGYSPDIFSDSLHDDLTATAFYFEQNGTKALLVSATLCLLNSGLSAEICKRIEARFGIPADHCILHATHTHSGPNTVGSCGWGDLDRTYCDAILIPGIDEAVAKALVAPVEARVEVRRGESLVGINRRQLTVKNDVILGQNPWGPFDPRMTVISFVNEKKETVANLVHYGCHGTASGKNTQISRDWSGVMIDVMEEMTGGITAFINGPEGDVGPRLTNGCTVGNRHVRYALELGAVAAQDAMRIRRTAGAAVDATLSISKRVLQIPLAPRVSLERANEELKKYVGQTVNLKGKLCQYYKDVIASYADGYTDAPTLAVAQTILRIGEIAIVSFPMELFSEIGMRIAEASPAAYTLALSNTNGSMGYFVTEDQILRGGYEVGMYLTANLQPYATHADHQMVLQTLAHLKGE